MWAWSFKRSIDFVWATRLPPLAACLLSACIVGAESGPSPLAGKRPPEGRSPSLAATPSSAHAGGDAYVLIGAGFEPGMGIKLRVADPNCCTELQITVAKGGSLRVERVTGAEGTYVFDAYELQSRRPVRLASATLSVTAPAGSAAAPAPPACGDSTCNGDETCSTCPNDCGACSAGSGGSGGALGTQTSWPCTNCITTVPASYDSSVPTPLVISLHGDEGSPRSTHGIWKQAALDNGYILLSPECPRDLGCTGRWGSGSWHRDGPAGSVAWINAQIDAVEAAYNIDRLRIYLVGGSRGSVYVGFHADAFAPRIAGAAMYGGGYSSITSTCASCALPVYILVGDRDFLLDIARKARGWFRGCGSEVVFDELPGVRHRGAGKSLLKGKANTILDWFTARPNACLPLLPRARARGG